MRWPPNPRGRVRLQALWLVLLLLTIVSGCARGRAKTTPDAPTALDVPVPPPRLVDPVDADVPPPARLPEGPARPVPARPRPTPPQTPTPAPARPEASKADAPKPEPAPAEAPKAAEEAPKPAPPSTTLQTTPTGAEGEVERSIRATLTRAASDLARVDYRGLNADARTQYDTAKRFIQQAEEAARAKNLVFAKNLAEKAGALAAQLAGK
jgi:hypothetical protein